VIRTLILAALIVTVTATPSSAQAKAPAVAPAASAAADPQPSAPSAQSPDPVEPRGYTYAPDGRRDPFVSLIRRGSELTRDPGSSRPAGLPGLATSEVTLNGIMASNGGYVAMVEGVDRKTYIVRSGDRLFDGTIRAISRDTMVIVQQVDDPLSPVKEREVRKVLRQEEAN
jgi:Tfp pilus assembly protein PilP